MGFKYLFVILLVLCACQPKSQLQRISGIALGTTYNIIYENPKVIDFNPIFEQINASMSTYIDNSIISRINQGKENVVVDSLFRFVYNKAKYIYDITDGYFDPTVGILVNAWGFGKEYKEKKSIDIDKDTIDYLMQKVGFEKISLTSKNTIQKENNNIYLDFNALAKGYCVDLIANLLEKNNTDNYLVEIGGEIVAKGINTKTHKPWTIGIDNPNSSLEQRKVIYKIQLKEKKAMATSGNYRKFKVDSITGKKYTHIINPKTGYPQQSNIISVSVLADSCIEADALATSFMIMPLEKTKKIINQKLKNIDVFIVYSNQKGEFQQYITEEFKKKFVN